MDEFQTITKEAGIRYFSRKEQEPAQVRAAEKDRSVCGVIKATTTLDHKTLIHSNHVAGIKHIHKIKQDSTAKSREIYLIMAWVIKLDGSEPEPMLQISVPDKNSAFRKNTFFSLNRIHILIGGLENLPNKVKKDLELDEYSAQLTKRERQVMELVNKSMTSNEIGEELFIATETVKNHRKNAKRKMKLWWQSENINRNRSIYNTEAPGLYRDGDPAQPVCHKPINIYGLKRQNDQEWSLPSPIFRSIIAVLKTKCN